MAKFIKIKDRLINVDKVQEFKLNGRFIYAFYQTDDFAVITSANEHEAALIFDDIPHLIDNDYIPDFVREQQLNELKWKARQAEAKAVINAMDASNWDELPF